MVKKITRKIADLFSGHSKNKKYEERFDKSVFLNKEVQLYKDSIEIGDHTYINGGKIFYAKIGKYCSIGYGVILGGGVHFTNTVTTYPIAARVCGYPGLKDFPEQRDCIIGNAVWIGNNAIIMQNVKVGDGAIVGAGAIVTKDVEPYTVVAGVPAKPIRTLFSQEDIDYLENIKWWDWPVEKIKKYYEKGAFNSIEDMKKAD